MDRQGFSAFLKDRKLSEAEIDRAILLAERFEAFLRAQGQHPGTKEDVSAFAARLIESGENTLENFYALARYGRFVKNDQVYIGVVDLLDGAEAMDNLYHKAGDVLGPDRRGLVFQRIPLPPMGAPNQEKVAVTQRVMPRLLEVADPAECQQILGDCLRDLEESWFQEDVKRYRECRTLDEYLDKNAQDFIAQLQKIREENGLFFTQKITDEVIEFVRSQPLVARGVREGDVLYEVKIPHMTVEYLQERDPQRKRYFYCHCPWVKEALKQGQADIPPVFCTCSAGFHKKRWEAIFEQPLQAEIVESVLQGDSCCKIAIHLPEGVA